MSLVVMGVSVDVFNNSIEKENDSYNPNMKYSNEDDGYGITWMYIPDGNGIPQIANLTEPDVSRALPPNLKEYIHFELYTK